MKGIATLPTESRIPYDICEECEFKKDCTIAYTNAAFECDKENK